MQLIKLDNGDYRPAYNSDKEESNRVKVGTEVKAVRSRNPKFHRKGFALLNLGFENQSRFDTLDAFRMVMTIKAGYYIEVPSTRGTEYLPKSLSFEKMNAAEFEKWYESVKTVIAHEIGTTKNKIDEEIENYF